MASKPAAQTARVNGLDLTYYEWGDPDSPALLCLHSHTSSADSWVEFAEIRLIQVPRLRPGPAGPR